MLFAMNGKQKGRKKQSLVLTNFILRVVVGPYILHPHSSRWSLPTSFSQQSLVLTGIFAVQVALCQPTGLPTVLVTHFQPSRSFTVISAVHCSLRPLSTFVRCPGRPTGLPTVQIANRQLSWSSTGLPTTLSWSPTAHCPVRRFNCEL